VLAVSGLKQCDARLGCMPIVLLTADKTHTS
jgi:hypothetical protein